MYIWSGVVKQTIPLLMGLKATIFVSSSQIFLRQIHQTFFMQLF